MDDGYDVVEVGFPALLTVVKDINEPRVPSLKGKMKAKKAEIKAADRRGYRRRSRLHRSSWFTHPGRAGLSSRSARGERSIFTGTLDEQIDQLVAKLAAISARAVAGEILSCCKVDKELCIGCGICEDQCPFGAIKIVDGCAVVGDACTLCGACVESCDVGALSLEGTEKTVQADLAAWSGVWVFCEFRRGDAGLGFPGTSRRRPKTCRLHGGCSSVPCSSAMQPETPRRPDRSWGRYRSTGSIIEDLREFFGRLLLRRC